MAASQKDLFEEPNPHGLWYYQREAKEASERLLYDGTSCLMVMATGTGKTRTFASIAADWPGRVLVLAHRDELVQQTAKTLIGLTGQLVGIEQASFYSGDEKIVVGSTQTVAKERRRIRMGKRGGFGLVIADEAHHYRAKSFEKAATHWGAPIFGATATPHRHDKKAMGVVFDEVSYLFGIQEAIQAGYHVPMEGHAVRIDKIDLSNVKSAMGDLNLKQLDEVMVEGVEGMVRAVLDRWPDRRGPAFFPRKRSAEYAAERFNALDPGCAAVVTADTDPDERREIIAKCRAGEIRYLCNCMVVTEGFDWPIADIVICGRPTKSVGLYTQMVGRGGRVLPGLVDGLDSRDLAFLRRSAIAESSKANCVIADFVGNCGKHAIVTPVDILGGNFDPEVVKIAKQIEKEEEGGEPQEVLRRAHLKFRAIAERVAAEVKHSSQKFDPFSILHIKGYEGYKIEAGDPITDRQFSALERCGIPTKELHGMSKAGAKKTLDTIMMRSKIGLASFKQLTLLKRHGVTPINISRARASKLLDYIASTGWGKKTSVDMDTIQTILDAKKAG